MNTGKTAIATAALYLALMVTSVFAAASSFVPALARHISVPVILVACQA